MLRLTLSLSGSERASRGVREPRPESPGFSHGEVQRRNYYRGYKALFDERSYSEPAKLPAGSKKFVDWILENIDKTHMIDGKAYNIVKHISSSGCYGDVFLAKEVGLVKTVAIKILRDSRDKEDEMLEMTRHKGGIQASSNIMAVIFY